MIGQLIFIYRFVNKITVRELAKHLGVSPATITRIESGKPCDQENMIKLINWLFVKAERPWKEESA